MTDTVTITKAQLARALTVVDHDDYFGAVWAALQPKPPGHWVSEEARQAFIFATSLGDGLAAALPLLLRDALGERALCVARRHPSYFDDPDYIKPADLIAAVAQRVRER